MTPALAGAKGGMRLEPSRGPRVLLPTSVVLRNQRRRKGSLPLLPDIVGEHPQLPVHGAVLSLEKRHPPHTIPRDGLLQETEVAVPDRSARIVWFCRGGNRGALAAAALLDHGFSNGITLGRGLEGIPDRLIEQPEELLAPGLKQEGETRGGPFGRPASSLPRKDPGRLPRSSPAVVTLATTADVIEPANVRGMQIRSFQIRSFLQ